MARMIIRLEVDPKTSKKTVVISYESDADALPAEHEEEHRQMVDKVMGGAVKNGKIAVERESERPIAEDKPQSDAQPEAQKQKR